MVSLGSGYLAAGRSQGASDLMVSSRLCVVANPTEPQCNGHCYSACHCGAHLSKSQVSFHLKRDVNHYTHILTAYHNLVQESEPRAAGSQETLKMVPELATLTHFLQDLCQTDSAHGKGKLQQLPDDC